MRPRLLLLGCWAFLAVVLGSVRTPAAFGCSLSDGNARPPIFHASKTIHQDSIRPVMYRQQATDSQQALQGWEKNSLSDYDAVFAGVPTSIENEGRYDKRVTFNVTKVWRGRIGHTITIVGSFCNGYSVGREQRVFAQRIDNELVDVTYSHGGFLPDLPENPAPSFNWSKVGQAVDWKMFLFGGVGAALSVWVVVGVIMLLTRRRNGEE